MKMKKDRETNPKSKVEYIYISTPPKNEMKKKGIKQKISKSDAQNAQFTNTRCTEIRWHSDIGKKKEEEPV